MCVATTPVVLHASTGYFFANCVPPTSAGDVFTRLCHTFAAECMLSRIPDTQDAATLLHAIPTPGDIRHPTVGALFPGPTISVTHPPHYCHTMPGTLRRLPLAGMYPLLLPGVSRTISSGVPRCSRSDGLAVPSSSLLQLEAKPASQRLGCGQQWEGGGRKGRASSGVSMSRAELRRAAALREGEEGGKRCCRRTLSPNVGLSRLVS